MFKQFLNKIFLKWTTIFFWKSHFFCCRKRKKFQKGNSCYKVLWMSFISLEFLLLQNESFTARIHWKFWLHGSQTIQTKTFEMTVTFSPLCILASLYDGLVYCWWDSRHFSAFMWYSLCCKSVILAFLEHSLNIKIFLTFIRI